MYVPCVGSDLAHSGNFDGNSGGASIICMRGDPRRGAHRCRRHERRCLRRRRFGLHGSHVVRQLVPCASRVAVIDNPRRVSACLSYERGLIQPAAAIGVGRGASMRPCEARGAPAVRQRPPCDTAAFRVSFPNSDAAKWRYGDLGWMEIACRSRYRSFLDKKASS